MTGIVSGKAAKLGWYLNRLRTMSPGEVAFRVRGTLRARLERLGFLTAPRPPRPGSGKEGPSWMAVPQGLPVREYVAQARGYAAGRLSVFALDQAELGDPPQWNRDPLTGTVAPLAPGKTLDYRDQSLVGDIKYLWEPNRHLHLVRLAQAHALTGEASHLEALGRNLESWLEQCPYLRGPNWTSSLELGIRLINWSLVWQLTGGRNSPLFQGERGQALLGNWLASIYQHVHFIHGHYSRFSSANNHLIGEAAGVFTASLTWPYWPLFRTAGKKARAILEREALEQNHEDGVNKEQAISYQQFVFDFLLISGLAARAGGEDFSTAYWRRMEAMVEYIASVMDVSGHVPMIGDADDGYVTSLSPDPGFCPYASMLATGAVLFNREDFRAKVDHLDDKTRWLLGPEADAAFGRLARDPHGLPVRTRFDAGGYYLMGRDFETAREIRMVMDCGPLGYLSIAAHGHADALALALSAGGREILVDTGTYAYHTRKKWRDYFRGTAAHNTLRIDGQDQSEMGGNFMWLRKAKAVLLEFGERDGHAFFSGAHDGYQRLAQPVSHQRDVAFDGEARRFMVTDRLQGAGHHQAERAWHFSEECSVTVEGGAVVARSGGVRVTLRDVGGKAVLESFQGDEDRPAGWISRRFDVKIPATTIVMTDQVEGDTVLQTEIVVEIELAE